MSEAVLDAGPLIHLAELQALDVLGDFSQLYVPAAVRQEVLTYQSKLFEMSSLPFHDVKLRYISSDLRTLARIFSLDRGEIEALSFMEEHPTAIFLTDDAAARLAAERQGYKVHGTIGLLIRAVRQGIRSPSETVQLLKDLPRLSSLHIRPVLLSEIINRLEAEWKQ